MTIKKKSAILAAAVGVLVVPMGLTPVASANSSVEEEFVKAASAILYPLQASYDEVLSLGYTECEALDRAKAAHGYPGAVARIEQSEDAKLGLSGPKSLLLASVLWLCPEHTNGVGQVLDPNWIPE